MSEDILETAETSKNTVLIITDSCELAGELSSILSEANIDPFVADTRDLYLKKITQYPRPVVAIVDEDMIPGGWKISEDIRNDSEVPIIIIGDSDSELAWMRAAEGKIDYFLGRPFGPLELVARIRSLARRSKRLTNIAEVM